MEPLTEAGWRTMPYPEALDILNQLRQATGAAATPADLIKTLTLSPTQQTATLAFLYQVLDPAGEPKTPSQGYWDMLPLLINGLSDAQIEILLSDILFSARSPMVYGAMAPGLRRRVTPAACEAAILRELASSDRRRRQNAIALDYYVFGWEPAYWMSEAGRQALEQARHAENTRP